jgi:hypothetical protein
MKVKNFLLVMAGLVSLAALRDMKAWMPGTGPGMTKWDVDRVEACPIRANQKMKGGDKFFGEIGEVVEMEKVCVEKVLSP